MLVGRAMYIWRLKGVIGAGSVDDVVARATRCKITSLWVKIGDGARPFENTKGAVGKQLAQIVSKCAQSGISVFGFHVPNCPTEESVGDEVDMVENVVRGFGLAGVVVDNEDGSGFFKGDSGTAALYASTLRAAMTAAGKLVVMSSNDIVSAHPKSYAGVIGKQVDINAPQVYYGQSKSVSARLNRAQGENKVISAPFFPIGAAFLRQPAENDGGFLDPQTCAEWAKDFVELVSLLHRASPLQFPGYGFWNWDEAPVEVWRVLEETEVFLEPAGAPVAERAHFAAEALAGNAPSPAAADAVPPPQGWMIAIRRLRTEPREGESFARTVGTYSVLHNGVQQPGLSGATVERQGPGDNGPTGKAQHRCIAAGSYPLRAHASAKYRTTGYAATGAHPRPAIEVGNTGDRTGILVHPADGYASTIGCINLAGSLSDADADISLPDSLRRVIDVIEDMRAFSGGSLKLAEDGSIQNARIVIADAATVARGLAALVAEAAPPGLLAEAPSDDCLVYEQATGRMLVRENGQYDTIGVGYSGSLSKGGKNDPSKQCEHDIGPIPRGRYTVGPPGPGPSPYSLRLMPNSSNHMCGRSNFLIHGDSVSHPGDASEGCIILSRNEREAIVKTGLNLLLVTDHISN